MSGFLVLVNNPSIPFIPDTMKHILLLNIAAGMVTLARKCSIMFGGIIFFSTASVD